MAEHRLTDLSVTVTWLGSVPEIRENVRSAARDTLPLTLAGTVLLPRQQESDDVKFELPAAIEKCVAVASVQQFLARLAKGSS